MIYFFNANMELKKVVNSESVVSAVHEHELNGVILSAIELDLSYARAFKDDVEYFGYYYENNFYIHKIRRVEEEHENESLVFVGRHIFFDELMTGELVQDVRPVERDAVYTADATIGNTTRWKPFGNNTTKHLSSNFYWELPMEALNTIVEQFRVEYLPIIEFDGKKITGTKLRIDERIGKDSGIRIPYGSRVLSLKYDIDYEQIITKLFVQGRGEEVGDGYGRRINIKDVNFSKDGVISPTGVFYLYDQSLIDEYDVRHGKEIFEDIEDVNELAQAGYDYYIENSRPKMLFTAEVAQIGNVSIGDTVNIIRREYDVYFKARIHKITVNLLNKSDASVELGDYEHFKESKVDRIERKNNEIVKKQTSNRIESLKRQFDTEFDAQVDEFRKEFEQKLIDVSAEIVADKERIENEMSQMKLDQQQRVEEIMTTIGEHDIHLQSIDENGLLKSDFILKPDGFILGDTAYDGSHMAQAIVGKAGAIDLIADNVNLSNNLNVANQIKSLSLETVYANISELRTRMLVADVITADMVKFDTALIEKFTSNTAFINSLTAKSAFISNVKAIDIDLNRATVTGGDGTNYIRMTNQNVMSYGTFTRSWGGETDTARLELGLYDGQLRMRNLDTGYRLYLTERGLSTSMAGAIDQLTSGTLEFHSQRFNLNSRGITMHSSYGAVAMVSDYSTAVIRSNLTANIESDEASIYLRPNRLTRPGNNVFQFYIKDNSSVRDTDGVIYFGSDVNAPGTGIRFAKESNKGVLWITDGSGDIGTGDISVRDAEIRGSIRTIGGLDVRTWDGTGYNQLRAGAYNSYNSVVFASHSGGHAYFGVGNNEMRVTNNNGYNGGNTTYRDVRMSTLHTHGGFQNHASSEFVYFGVGSSTGLRVTNNAHYNGGNIGWRDIEFRNWNANSHEKYKTDISAWNLDVLDLFKELQLYQYKYRDDRENNRLFHRSILIREDSNLNKFPVEWLNGDMFNGNEILWWTVKGVQELAHENDTLKDRINDLENKLNKIMEMMK